MNCDNRRIVEFGATTAPQNAAKTLLNRYDVERASIAWHVTEFASRRVSCINYLHRVTRVYTRVVEKKQAWDHASYCSVEWTRSKKSKSVLESEKKSSILTCLCRISEHYSRPSNQSTKARNDVSGRSLSSATPSEYPCPECGISTLLLSHRAPFSYKVRPRNIFFYYTFLIEIVAPPKNGNKLSLA